MVETRDDILRCYIYTYPSTHHLSSFPHRYITKLSYQNSLSKLSFIIHLQWLLTFKTKQYTHTCIIHPFPSTHILRSNTYAPVNYQVITTSPQSSIKSILFHSNLFHTQYIHNTIHFYATHLPTHSSFQTRPYHATPCHIKIPKMHIDL